MNESEEFLDTPRSTVGPYRYRLYRSRTFWRHTALFLLTIFTTLIAGVMMEAGPGVTGLVLTHPSLLLIGAPFSLSIMAILLAHEMGHYLASRYYGVATSLPYFLPSPFFLLDLFPSLIGAIFNPGTFGAVIVTRSMYPNRRALMDIGAAGPIAGFIVAVPIMAYGISLSNVSLIPQEPRLERGEPLIFQLLSYLILGPMPEDFTLLWHPVGIAAWFGLLVTMLNLLPVGQLDGGHILYAFTGANAGARMLQRGAFIGSFLFMAALGIYFPGWWVFGGLLLVMGRLTGFRHPRPYDNDLPLSWRGKCLGGLALIIFILSFMPIPMEISLP